MGGVTALLSVLLLEESPLPSPLPEEPPIDPSRVTPGLLALISFVFLIIAIVLLYRSMRKQIARVDPNLPEGPGDAERAADERFTEEAEERGAAQENAPENVQESGSDEPPTR